MKNCDLAGASQSSSTISSRTPSPSPSLMSIMCPGYKPTITVSHIGTPISTPLLKHITQQSISDSLTLHEDNTVRTSGVFNTAAIEQDTTSTAIAHKDDDGLIISSNSRERPISNESILSDISTNTFDSSDNTLTPVTSRQQSPDILLSD